MFSNPRFMNGAASNPNFDVVAKCGVQVKNAIDATVKLGGTACSGEVEKVICLY